MPNSTCTVCVRLAIDLMTSSWSSNLRPEAIFARCWASSISTASGRR